MKSRSEILDRFVKAFLFYAIMDYSKNLDLQPIKYFCEFDKVWKTEEWRDIPNYKGIYQVSDLGRVKTLSRLVLKKGIYPFICKEKILKSHLHSTGYLKVALVKDKIKKTTSIHQLVSESFLNHKRCGQTLVVNHKNFIKTDNRKVNLEIVTNRVNSNKKHLKSSSIYTGVTWHKSAKKWRSQINIFGKMIILGMFDCELEASKAYENKLKEITLNETI